MFFLSCFLTYLVEGEDLIYTPLLCSEIPLLIINQTTNFSKESVYKETAYIFPTTLKQANTSIILTFCPFTFTFVQWNNNSRL